MATPRPIQTEATTVAGGAEVAAAGVEDVGAAAVEEAAVVVSTTTNVTRESGGRGTGMEAVDGTAAGVALAAAEGDRGAAAEAAGDTSLLMKQQ
jgi:hypothetical protein